MENYKIAVLGDRESVMGFKALGLSVFPIENEEYARHTLRRLTRNSNEYAIIYITERFGKALSADIDKFKDSPTPAIILIPGKEGSLGLGLSALQSAVERAVGSNIL